MKKPAPTETSETTLPPEPTETSEPTPELEAPDTRSIDWLMCLGIVAGLAAIVALVIISRSRTNSGGPPSEAVPPPDEGPVPDPQLDTLIAIYRSNGEVLPPVDNADLRTRLKDLVYGIYAYAVCNHREVVELLREVEDFDPSKAFYYLVEYRCPGGFIREDMKSGAMRATETRRALSLEGAKIEKIRYFHYLPEHAGLQAFK